MNTLINFLIQTLSHSPLSLRRQLTFAGRGFQDHPDLLLLLKHRALQVAIGSIAAVQLGFLEIPASSRPR
jgi:hypothetical protein